MKTTALPVSREHFQPWPEVIARAPAFIALTKPRVMALAVFTAAVGLVIAPGHLDPLLGTVFIALGVRLSRSHGADWRAAQHLFVFSITYLFLLFAALLADHHVGLGAPSVSTKGAHAERMTSPKYIRCSTTMEEA